MSHLVECTHCGETFKLEWVSAGGDLYWCEDCRRLGAELWRKIGEYRTELANEEYEKRQQRWLANAPRRGGIIPIRAEDSRNNKAFVDRYHQKVDPTKSRRATKPKLHLADPGLRNWSDETCSREEYFKIMDQESGRHEEWLL